MCGICGLINADPARPAQKERVLAMNRCLNHRGPDEDGLHLAGRAALAHKRLSIIDLATGQQPMTNEDATCWIVFNGEIYNHHSLRAGLVARGHGFKTHSDTETILHLYEEQGERCVEALRGMFAFAIWNERTQELLLARDRVGKKPLFYAMTGEGIAFASEMKALLADPALPREVDLESLQDYLALQYVPAPATIFKGINKLPPAHTLRWRDGRAELRRYWRLDYEPKTRLSEEVACEQIREGLDEAVRIRLESEVPLGCLLSGGVDSSAVVAFMRRHVPGKLRTFSIGFDEASHNELPFARTVAERFATEHEEFIVRPDAARVLPRLVWHCDEPFADSSALPTFYVAEITRRHVTVALNGDGGDESFAGYTRYLGDRRVERYKLIPSLLRRWAIGPLAGALAARRPESALFEQAKYLNEASLMPPGLQYAQYMLIFRDYQRRALCVGELGEAARRADPVGRLLSFYQRADLASRVDRMLFCDVEAYLPGDLLVKMDRMTMAHSLEGRSPFLDHQLMELAARLPGELKLKRGESKYLLKKAMEPILPREIMYRPKRGFSMPLRDWFRSGPLRELACDVLLSAESRRRGWFDAAYIEKMLAEHAAGRQNHHHRLWSLLSLELWCRTFLDRSDPGQGPLTL